MKSKPFFLIQVNNEWLTKLAQWLDQNNIKVNVKKTFLLDEVVTVLDYQEDVSPRGKIVLTL
jgi:NADPH:quinone reductase-like Zn-dependent oxidoreductase